MIFDDHDVHDDWNTSHDWVETIRATGLVGRAHRRRASPRTGSTSTSATSRPRARGRRRLQRGAASADDARGDPARVRLPGRPRRSTRTQWSFCRDLGSARLIMVDSRAGRDPRARAAHDGRRRGVGLDRASTRPATSRPPADRDLAAVADGARACTTSRPGTRRCARARGAGRRRAGPRRCARALDLEHWAAFSDSFDRDARLLGEVGAGRRRRGAGDDRRAVGRRPPRLPGRGRLPAGRGVQSNVYQAVCSPFRNPLDTRERRGDQAIGVASRRPRSRAAGAGRRRAGPPACAGSSTHEAPCSTTRSPRCARAAGRARSCAIEAARPSDDGRRASARDAAFGAA